MCKRFSQNLLLISKLLVRDSIIPSKAASPPSDGSEAAGPKRIIGKPLFKGTLFSLKSTRAAEAPNPAGFSVLPVKAALTWVPSLPGKTENPTGSRALSDWVALNHFLFFSLVIFS